MKLAGRVAVITGAASGIGLASARLFAEEGALVVLGDVDEAGGREAAERIQAAGLLASFLPTDVTRAAEVERLVARAVELHGKLDLIFNNAGITMGGSILERDEADFDRVIGVNLKGVFFGCKYALPHLLANPDGGVIVNMSSNGGIIGRPGDPLYNATKHGVMGLTKSLALAYADQRVRVNALCPGPIGTQMVWGEVGPESAEREAQTRRAVAACPTPRVAEAEEVARAALFLACDDSSFISGVGLPVDGAKSAGVFKAERYRLDFELI
jgi:NAD(P)-dependent dehydrogenase (short-subunit alcohol dehydrogenase family)